MPKEKNELHRSLSIPNPKVAEVSMRSSKTYGQRWVGLVYLLSATPTVPGNSLFKGQRVSSDPQSRRDQSDYPAPQPPATKIRAPPGAAAVTTRTAGAAAFPRRPHLSRVARTPGSPSPGRGCAVRTGPSTRGPSAAERLRASPLPPPAHMAAAARASTQRAPRAARIRWGPRSPGGDRGRRRFRLWGGGSAAGATAGVRGGACPDRRRGQAERGGWAAAAPLESGSLPASRSTSPVSPA